MKCIALIKDCDTTIIEVWKIQKPDWKELKKRGYKYNKGKIVVWWRQKENYGPKVYNGLQELELELLTELRKQKNKKLTFVFNVEGLPVSFLK